MALLDIYVYPDPVLRQEAAEVEKVDGKIQKLIDDMAETMYNAPGIGLAANQVGIPVRIIVMDLQRPEVQEGLLALVNPKIVSAEGSITYEEGCLSVPEYYANVRRFRDIVVEALDREGNPVEIKASGLLAVVLQHEIDHLDGKLFVDRLGPISRDIFKRKWKKKMAAAVA